MKIFEDFLLRNKIVTLKIRITDLNEWHIWREAIANIDIEFLKSHEVIHEDKINYLIDITIDYECKYTNYRKIIQNLQEFDRTLMYDPKTRLSYIIISVKNSLQKREAA